jgi:hypothetical protein
MLKKAQTEGKISGVKPSRLLKVILLMFLDDVMIMNLSQVAKWEEIFSILTTFCRAVGLFINPQKSSMHF